jgi:ABC-type branched-subunit amino acid transport system substrate-binding protein
VRARTRSVALVFAVTLPLALVGAGCGSSDDSSSTGAATAAASGQSTSGGSSTSGKATGTPIKVSTFAGINVPAGAYPHVKETANVYAKWINDQGGINGHPLEIEFCDNKNDPAATTACMRKANDGGVVADVGSMDGYAPTQAADGAQQLKIPYIGSCCASTGPALQGDYTFSVAPSVLTTAAYGKIAAEKCKATSLTGPDNAIWPSNVAMAESGMELGGGKLTASVPIPLEPVDLTSQAAQLTAKGEDCIIAVLAPGAYVSLLTALEQIGKHVKIIGSANLIAPEVLDRFKDYLPGSLTSGSGAPDGDPAWDDYHAAWKKYSDPSKFPQGIAGTAPTATWIAMDVFTQVAKSIKGDVTRESLFDALNKANNVDTGGLTPTLDLTKPWTENPDAPRMFNRNVKMGEVQKDGSVTCADPCEWIDVSGAFVGK